MSESCTWITGLAPALAEENRPPCDVINKEGCLANKRYCWLGSGYYKLVGHTLAYYPNNRDCVGKCTVVDTDPLHCGKCGTKCISRGFVCSRGLSKCPVVTCLLGAAAEYWSGLFSWTPGACGKGEYINLYVSVDVQ